MLGSLCMSHVFVSKCTFKQSIMYVHTKTEIIGIFGAEGGEGYVFVC